MAAGELRQTRRDARTAPRSVLIVGGAGFLGSSLADALLSTGWRVRLLDNLAAERSAANLAWLEERHRGLVDAAIADADDWPVVSRQMTGAAVVFHLIPANPRPSRVGPAGAGPSSSLTTAATIVDVAATQPERPALVVASNHRAYGPLDDIEVLDAGARFEPVDRRLARHGIDESYVGAVANGLPGWQAISDRYLLARARRVGLTLAVLRLGTVYGPRQSPRCAGGWIPHHLASVFAGRSPSLTGDPRRVRDVLFIDDAVDALLVAAINADRLAGRLFNVGGGARNALSVLGLHELVQQVTENPIRLEHRRRACVRDQRWYVSDHRRFSARTGWQPGVGAASGLALVADSLADARSRP